MTEMVLACDRCLARSALTPDLGRVAQPATEQAAHSGTPGAVAAELADLDAAGQHRLARRYARWSAAAAREAVLSAGLWARCHCEAEYPEALRALTDPPPVLYVRGDPSLLQGCPHHAAALVGTRRPTVVGREAARRIAAGVGRAGGLIVSGMALGVDAAAHDGALGVQAPTIAVLGSGADYPAPATNARLYERILDRGAVVSELPPGTAPRRWTFPARNRIIAALSAVTVVVEAPERSGALITVEHATELGREIGAVPGSLAADTTGGSNRLLAEGAAAILDGASLAAMLGLHGHGAPAGEPESPARRIRALLEARTMSSEQLEQALAPALSGGELEIALLDLELAGWIMRAADGRYTAAASGAGAWGGP